MPEALIIDACRTPRGIGKQGKGALAHLHPQHLGATVLAALAVPACAPLIGMLMIPKTLAYVAIGFIAYRDLFLGRQPA